MAPNPPDSTTLPANTSALVAAGPPTRTADAQPTSLLPNPEVVTMAHQAVDSWAQHLRRTAEALLGLHQQGEEQSLLLSQQMEELEEKRGLLAKESALLEVAKADLTTREGRLRTLGSSPTNDAAESSSAAAIGANLQRVLVAVLVEQKKNKAPLAQVEEL